MRTNCRTRVSIPEILTAQVPGIMAGSLSPDSSRSVVSSRAGGPRLDSREREGNVYGHEKRRDVRLLLAAAVPQKRIAALPGVSVRTIRRIAREPTRTAPPEPGTKTRRAGPGRPPPLSRSASPTTSPRPRTPAASASSARPCSPTRTPCPTPTGRSSEPAARSPRS